MVSAMVEVCTECYPYTGGGQSRGHWCQENSRKEVIPGLSLKILGKVRQIKKEWTFHKE